jgi:hypothetical protein
MWAVMLLALGAFASEPEDPAASVASVPGSATEAVEAPAEATEASDAGEAEEGADEATGADTEPTLGEADEAEGVTAEEAEPPYPLLWEGQATPETSTQWDLEVLYHDGRSAEGLELAKQRLAADPTDADLTWMIARFMFEIGETFQRDDESIDKVAYYKEMLDIVDEGLEHHPDDAHLRFARGIAVGRYGTTRGVLASLFLAKEVERDWLFTAESGFAYSSIGAEEHLPCDAYQALGIYYRLVPDWWIVKVLAGTRGDLDTSLSYLERANRCAPDRIRNLKELGVTQMCIGTKRKQPDMVEKGKVSVRAYMALPANTKTEKIDLKHGQLLLDDPTLACEYSRDGQQDLDRENLDE